MTAFDDDEIVRLLKTNFVPVATYTRDLKRQDADGEFFRKVCKPVPYWQSGASVFTADGKILGTCSATSRVEVFRLIESALPKFQPPEKPYVIEPAGKLDENRYVVETPEGVVVVNSMMTHLSQRGRGRSEHFDKLRANSIGVDRLWIRHDEVEALASKKFPETLKRRLTRWHLIDNITFEQNRDEWVKKFDIKFVGDQLVGSVAIDSGKHSLTIDLLGFIESKNGKITRFDIVARGTRTSGKSSYPVGYAFALADESHVAFHVPPYPVLGYSKQVYFRD